MNDIFLSYAAEDRERAHVLAGEFERRGFSVWWDREIPPGKSFDQVIEAELNSARSVVVLWSAHSVKSRWVKTEAAAAADRNCLVPILIDDVPIPFEFRRIQTARLLHWDNPTEDPEFLMIVDAVRETASRNTSVSSPLREQTQRRHATAARTDRANRWVILAAITAVVVVLAALGILLSSRTVTTQPEGEGDLETPSTADAPVSADGLAPADAQAPADVPAPAMAEGAMPFRIGERISDGKPVPGAGSIENPFSEDVYVFRARPRQNVFFRVIEHGTGMQYLRWIVRDELGMEIFNSCLGCGQPGVRTLVRGGTYEMRVGSAEDPSTGLYALHVIDVPDPDRFRIKAGETVREDVPAQGAGIIESPGVEDVYTFTAAPRQRVYVRVREHSPGIAQLRLRLTDENGMAILDQCLGCGQSAAQTLLNGGTYTITVGSKIDPATGSYSFDIGSP
jgi:hypothetical protein